VPPEQQPVGHELELQTQPPLTHACPDGHAAQLAPLTPHELLLSLESGSQLVPLQQPAQTPPPHAQAPLVHACPD
jgi:hypothetical protein